ncbi:hypothetical protein Tco_0647609 [Tanacetum coccineum]
MKQRKRNYSQSESEGSDDEDISDLKKITALLAKAFNRKKYYAKPTNNNLRTSSASSSRNQSIRKDILPKTARRAQGQRLQYYKTKDVCLARKMVMNKCFLLRTKLGWSPVVIQINRSVQIWSSWLKWKSESEYETSEYYDNSTNYGLFGDNDDDQEIFHDAIESASENFNENHIASQTNHDESEVDHNDSEEKDYLVDKLIKKFNQKIPKLLNEKNDDLLAQTEVLQEQLKVRNVVIDTHTKCQAQYAKLEEEIYEYMIRYSALCDNDKQHKKKIDEQEILFDKMSHQLVEMNNNVMRLQEKILEKIQIMFELEECDKLYNGRKGIGFENPSYFFKAKELRPSLYDERVIGLGYTPMFLTHSDEALEIEKFKRAGENKIEFAYDYGNLNESLESSENAISESESQSENDCQMVEKGCDNLENSNVAQTVSLISVSKHTRSAYAYNDAMNVSCNSRMHASYDVNDLFVLDDVSVRNSRVSKMPFIKKPRDSLNVRSKSNLNNSLPITLFRWLPKMQPLAEPISKWIPKIVQICLWIIDSGCSNHMTGKCALLTNFVEKFLGTVHFGNNDFAVIAGYGDVF